MGGVGSGRGLLGGVTWVGVECRGWKGSHAPRNIKKKIESKW